MAADQRPASAPGGRVWIGATTALTVGAMVGTVMLAPPAGAQPTRALSFLLFTGSSVHVASTAWLLSVPTVRDYVRAHPVRCLWVPASLVIATALTAAIIPPGAFQWLLLPYFGWQFFHYQKQNLGMAALAATAARVRPLSRAERGALLGAGLAVLGALASDPGLLALRLHPELHWLHQVSAAAFAVAVLTGVLALARRASTERSPGSATVYLTSLLFGLPVFVFSSPYAAVGGMTLAHGLQYLLLVTIVAGAGSGSRSQAASARPVRQFVRLAALANVALIGGAGLSLASHLHSAAPAGRLVFGGYLGLAMTHFVIDAGIWRFRDPLARKFVTDSLPFVAPVRLAAEPREPIPAAR